MMERPINKAMVCPTIVGRVSELAALWTIVGEVEGGSSHIVLLSGEAGIGKSRLVAELEAEAYARRFLVLQGNCFQRDMTSPYAPVLDLIRSFLAPQSIKDREALLQPFAQEFFPVLPDLVTPPPPPAMLPASGPEQEKRRLFVALTAFFTKLAAERPLVFVIEDIHWCDESTLEYLQYFLQHSTAFPWLVVLTYRSDEMRPSLTDWLAQLDRERRAQEFSLARLSRNDVDAMLTAIFELHSPIRSELLNTLYPLTEGNPFFVEEVLTSLRAAGGIFFAEGTWRSKALEHLRLPRSIQAAVQQRSDRLSEAARELLTLAAVAGRRFDVDLLLHIMQQTEEHLLSLLKELIAAHLVVEESGVQFAFRHALTRYTIYEQLLKRERKVLHQRLAQTMEQVYQTVLDAHLEDLAYHFMRAEEWTKALPYAQRAGEKALALYAPHAAVEHFANALFAARKMALPPPAHLFLVRGQAYEMLGELERARADYEASLQITRSTGERHDEWEGLLHLGMLWAGRDYERSGEYYQHAILLARTLGNPSFIARSLNRVGNWHLNVERPLEALAYHQEALHIFQELEDTAGIAETLDLLGMTSYLSGDLVRGTSYYEQAVTLFRQLDDRQGLTSSLATMTMRGITYQTDTMIPAIGHASEVTTDGELALKIARETDQRAAEAYVLVFLAFCLGPQGEYARALECARQGLRIAEEIDHRQWMTAAHCALGTLYRDLFALPEARRHLEQALHLANETCSLHWIRTATGHLASTYVLAHELRQAEHTLQVALTPNTPTHTLGQRLVWCARAELALAQNDLSQGAQIIERLMTSAINIDESRCILRLARLHGEVLLALNQLNEAQAVLQRAREVAQQQGALPLLWRIQLDLGKCYQAQRRYEAAEECFLAARDTIEQISLNVPVESLHADFLRHVHAVLSPIPPPLPRRTVKRSYNGLTEREREIAGRIARGQTSREMAEALVISERTVETHIGNILAKLGYHARTQIAAWAAEKGMGKQDK